MKACSVCENPQAAAISAALEAAEPVRAVARRFGLARTTVARHRAHSLLTATGKPSSRDPFAEALGLLSRARGMGYRNPILQSEPA